MAKKKPGITLTERNLTIAIALIIVVSVAVLVMQQKPAEYCGDGVCSSGETVISCARDCQPHAFGPAEPETPAEPQPPVEPPAEQPPEAPQEPPVEGPSYQHDVNRELDENVFEDTIGIENENGYKGDGYVIVRYFYNINCPLCASPVKWDDVLQEIAGEMNDIVILELFDTDQKKWAKDRWGKVGIDVPDDPVIRIEGMPGGEHAYKVLYGNPLSELFGSPKERLFEEICAHTDQC